MNPPMLDPTIDPEEFKSLEKRCDHWIVSYLKRMVALCSKKMLNGEINEFTLPNGISLAQVNQLYCELPSDQITFEMHWFYPILEVQLCLKSKDNGPPIQVSLQLSSNLRDQILQINRYRCRRVASDRSNRSNNQTSLISELSFNNFNILTYFNTPPLVPKVIPKYLISGDALGGGCNCLVQIQAYLANNACITDSIRTIKVVIGLMKEDKVNFIVSLNNQHLACHQPCRIVYLQTHSLLTFWMAMKVKALCNDLYWNVIGYQITLESKTSPNNSIIFFEVATFIRALNRHLDLHLITHLVIDIDHDHVLFKLLLLYLKVHFFQLNHLVIYIITSDEKKVLELSDYFGAEYIRSAYFHYTDIICPYIKQLFLEDFQTVKVEEVTNNVLATNNFHLEELMPECWTCEKSVRILVEIVCQSPSLLNYACHKLSGITSLIIAVVHGTVEQIYRLLAFGADARKSSWNQVEPIEWAIQYRKERAFQLLFTHLYALEEGFDIRLQKYYAKKFLNAAHRLALTNDVSPSSIVQRPKLQVDFDLILYLLPRLIRKIYFSHANENTDRKDTFSSKYSSILVLLPSYGDVSFLRKMIVSELSNSPEYEFSVLCLYSNIPNSELEPAIELLNSKQDQVHVILSTFSVDCIFLDSISFIINTGVNLEKLQSPLMNLAGPRLIPNQSYGGDTEYEYKINPLGHRSSMITVYNLFSREEAANLIGKNTGDLSTLQRMYTDSMYHCIYSMKCFNFPYGTIDEIFKRMVCRYKKEVVSMSVNYLKNINVIKGAKEEMTELGKILMDLAIEPHYAKMIIYSVVLRCLDPILTIVCALSSPNPFQIKIESDACRWQENCMELHQLSHNSFSDHIAYIYAFQKWQEMSRAGHSFSDGISFGITAKQSSIFEMIYSLRTRLLGQLRAIGLVKGKGPLSIRNLNSNSDNFTLVKAAISGGQPLNQFVMLSQLANKGYFLHPASVMSHYLASGNSFVLPSGLLLFDRSIIGGKVSYLHNCTLINPLTVALFADENSQSEVTLQSNDNADESCLRFGNLFELTGENMDKVYQIRQQLQATIQRRLSNMQQSPGEEENNLLKDIGQLVSAHDDHLGFNLQPAIGKAPQVMSTYFCSTFIIKKDV